jgi:hypothetical protein
MTSAPPARCARGKSRGVPEEHPMRPAQVAQAEEGSGTPNTGRPEPTYNARLSAGLYCR